MCCFKNCRKVKCIAFFKYQPAQTLYSPSKTLLQVTLQSDAKLEAGSHNLCRDVHLLPTDELQGYLQSVQRQKPLNRNRAPKIFPYEILHRVDLRVFFCFFFLRPSPFGLAFKNWACHTYMTVSATDHHRP